MTEAEWLSSTIPRKMLAHLEEVGTSERKLRHFTTAACRRVERWFSFTIQQTALDVLEKFAEGRASSGELQRVCYLVGRLSDETHDFGEGSELSQDVTDARFEAANAIAQATCNDPVGDDQPTYYHRVADTIMHVADGVGHGVSADAHPPGSILTARLAEYESLASLFRDIIGNPFRPVVLDPAWLTSTVVALAGGIYEERAFDRLPILADALMDAGCANDDVLNHCRSDGPHVRGCWVIDLILGKP